ncbi:MAG TPA: chromosome segregation protein SMC, partial [Bacteroidetes bacterium]|nr:chromosome segregation protein SMC [Bacteroidota bacterium]
MYLSNLKIHGFKSFAHKTLLDFNGGLTCIVGPNGCGKSNIVDAVRWVLGEQRAGILRSEKMENVIFSGSKTAKPLGMAEVSMTIQNNRNVLPIEYSEVMITRRLYRSGESEYLLNKTHCRLKDIRDLFIDTGVGPDTYSVIELKMVESILSSKSDERLGLFEEAAGINKYKQRRNAAFRKLEATNGDLNRVVDILSEVERNVNSLKRQVSHAERYQALNHEVEELEIRAASLKYFVLQKKLKPLKNDLTNLERNYQQNRSVLSRDEADLEKNRVLLMTMEDSLAKFQRNLSRQTEAIHRNENIIIVTQERFKATEEKIQRYAAEREQLKKRVEILRQRIKENEPNLGMLGEKVDALRMRYRLKEQELAEFEKALARRRLDANEAQTQLIQLLETINEKEKERNLLESQLIHQEGRI